MQLLKRMEQTLTIATEQLVHTQSVYSKLQAQVVKDVLLAHLKPALLGLISIRFLA